MLVDRRLETITAVTMIASATIATAARRPRLPLCSTTVVAIMPGPADGGGSGAPYLAQFFTSVRAVATLSNPYGLHNQEWHGHVYLCTGPRHPWGQMWPQLRQYS